MACYSPLKLWYDRRSRNEENGKLRIIKVTAHNDTLYDDGIVKSMDIPCGQCIGCRLDYSRRWADRIMLELQLHDQSKCWFVTLTYDEKHINLFETCARFAADLETGLTCDDVIYHSLNIKNLQDFMKNLRYHLEPDRVRFFAAGEYGDESGRPHYHLILFNADLEKFGWDENYEAHNFNGNKYRSSKLLQSVWKYGFNVCAPVSWKDAAYVARYMLKKQKGEGAKVYTERNIDPPFSVMSRRPGIAHDYYVLHPHAVYDKTYISTDDGKKTISPPKYFRDLLYYDDPESWIKLSDKNKFLAENREKLLMSQTTLSKLEYLENVKNNTEKRMEILNSYRNAL